MSEFMKRAICHEAGHIVVAHNYGIAVEGVKVAGGLTITDVHMGDPDSPSLGAREMYIFLAGGIAGEQYVLGSYDRAGMQNDQTKISEWGGGPIESYLRDALAIVGASKSSLNQIRKKLSSNWIIARAEAQFCSDPDSYPILSRVELQDILRSC
jgi:hypothetical protein